MQRQLTMDLFIIEFTVEFGQRDQIPQFKSEVISNKLYVDCNGCCRIYIFFHLLILSLFFSFK